MKGTQRKKWTHDEAVTCTWFIFSDAICEDSEQCSRDCQACAAYGMIIGIALNEDG